MRFIYQGPAPLCLGLLLIGCLCSCGDKRTMTLLQDKHWRVTDVTPPQNGNFDIEDQNEAQDLKATVYQDAWFAFSSNGIFRASFEGKVDSGKFKLSGVGKIISLYPLHGDTIYEQIQIQHLDPGELDFNTLIARFYMTLHCHPDPGP